MEHGRLKARNTQQNLVRQLDIAARSDAPRELIIAATISPVGPICLPDEAKFEVGTVVERN